MLMTMKTALIVLATAAALRSAAEQTYPRLTRIADGVYTYEQADPTKRGVAVNNLIVVTSDGVLVADGQGTVENTKRLVDDVATITPQPIRSVVVGSIHGDHRGGDAAFPPGVTFVKSKTDLTLGGREIRVLFLGRAHTGTDLEVYLPRERIMYMSESFSNDIFPSMANGYPSEWIAALKRAEELPVDTYVPAHSPQASSKLSTTRDDVRNVPIRARNRRTRRPAAARRTRPGGRCGGSGELRRDRHLDPEARERRRGAQACVPGAGRSAEIRALIVRPASAHPGVRIRAPLAGPTRRRTRTSSAKSRDLSLVPGLLL